MTKRIRNILSFALAILCFTGMEYAICIAPVSAAQKTVAEETPTEPAGNLGGYDCTHDGTIKDAIRNAKDSVDVTNFGITKDNISRVHNYIIRTFPDLCSSPNWVYTSTGTNVTKLTFTYSQDRQSVLSKYRELKRVKDHILSGLDPQMTDVEKALALHDYIVSHCAYDSQNIPKADSGAHTGFPKDDATAYGILVRGTGICQGYSMAYAYLMQACGIPCIYVSSETANHAWNLAFLDGHWYHIDTTWDDPTWDKLGYVGHKLFAVSTKTMLAHCAKKSDFIATDKGGDVSLQAQDQTYETGFWQDTDAGIHYYKGQWYYIDKDTFDVCAYHFASKERKILFHKPEEKWKVWNKSNVYIQSLSKTAAFDKDFYYTTPDAVWKVDLENGREKKIFSIDTSDGYIYGLGTIGSELFYVQKKQPGGEGAETYLPLNRNVAHTGTGHKWAEADQIPPICTREGTVIYHCTKNGCMAVTKKSIPKDADAHEYYEELVHAYYKHNGSLTQICRNCKNIRSMQTIYAPKTMKFSSFSFTYNKKIQKPTITMLDNRGEKIPSSSYQLTYSNQKSRYPGRYTAHVRFHGQYRGGFSGEYWISPPGIKIQKTVSKKGAFTVSWKSYKNQLADGYEIYYVPAGSQGQEKIKTVSGASADNVTVKNLKSGTTVWVYLRTYKNAGKEKDPLRSAWSEGVAVRIL